MARVQLAVAAIALAQSAAFSTLPASPPSRAFVVSSRNAPLHVSAIAEPPAPVGNGNQHQQAKKKSSNKKRRKPKAKLVNGDKQVKVTVSKKKERKVRQQQERQKASSKAYVAATVGTEARIQNRWRRRRYSRIRGLC
mmetsp:Transcript_17030/g.36942  ORF Transcript_17030/g.36942 Transcript_17030/m.36942 type:complete len:138 (-) Transcript_17030:428-841(-)